MKCLHWEISHLHTGFCSLEKHLQSFRLRISSPLVGGRNHPGNCLPRGDSAVCFCSCLALLGDGSGRAENGSEELPPREHPLPCRDDFRLEGLGAAGQP